MNPTSPGLRQVKQELRIMNNEVTLCFDFGNTRLKCGVLRGDKLQEVVVLEDDDSATIGSLIEKYEPVKSILSSVINHNAEMESLLSMSTRFHKLDHQSRLPVTTPVGKPQDIGADRLALVAAAVHLYPEKNNLVVGLGSAITYNFINKNHEFVGGGISPGMEMRFKSLHMFTAKLPLVEKDWNFPLFGYDTVTNITSGVILGMAKEIDGMIDAYAERYGNFNVLLTGGDAPYFVYHLKNKIFADPNLIFKGLYAISEYNNV
jgi:type III pantothenate kinase